MRFFIKHIAAIGLSAVLIGCSSDSGDTTSVSGRVRFFDLGGSEILNSVQAVVYLSASPNSFMTNGDANGNWSFSNLKNGDLCSVYASASGFGVTKLEACVPGWDNNVILDLGEEPHRIPAIDSVVHNPDSIHVIYFTWPSEHNADVALLTRTLLTPDDSTSIFTIESNQILSHLSGSQWKVSVRRFSYNSLPREAAVVAYNEPWGTHYGGTQFLSSTNLSTIVRLW